MSHQMTLTPRQLQVLRLIARGNTNDEIAMLLDIAPSTVKIHSGTILRRLRARSRSHAVAIGFQRGWLS